MKNLAVKLPNIVKKCKKTFKSLLGTEVRGGGVRLEPSRVGMHHKII
jgi:hypothetical protein